MLVNGLVSVALFLYAATGVFGQFSVTTSTPNLRVKENEGADLICSHSADFGQARVEWKFSDRKGSTTYVVFDGKPTDQYKGRVTTFDGNVRFSKVTRKDTGVYDCEVSGNGKFGEAKVKLTVLVPPSPPLCRIPTSITTGRKVVLSCYDSDGSPPPSYTWFKNGTPLPDDPSKFPAFKNFTYKLDTATGNLMFPSATKMDSGAYYCEASNDAGPAQRCKGAKMDVRDVNTGGIVAGVIVALLLLALLGLGIWYANKKGYLPKRSESKPKPTMVYQPPALDDEDGEFRQKSSFVV